MTSRIIEIVVGLFVIAGVAAFALLALQVSGLVTYTRGDSYELVAHFDNIASLKPRAPVTVAGVKIGQVKSIDLDKETFRATVTLQVDGVYRDTLPVDSSASILTAGIVGANYISVSPGFEEIYLRDGDEIINTHPGLILENLIGQFLFQLKNQENQ